MARLTRFMAWLKVKATPLLLGLGLITLVFVLATLFTPLTEHNPDISSTVPIEVGTPAFRRAVESVSGAADPLAGNTRIFNNGTAFLNDLISEIDGAKKSVAITNYIFNDGEMTEETFDALARAAGRGVAVRLLLDDHGANRVREESLERLEAAGVRIARFRPVSFRTVTRVHRRSHVRAITIDGMKGYMGGLAFSDDWFGNGVGERWRDLMFKFEGLPARAIADQFNALWRQTDGEILSGPAFYPELGAPKTHSDESYFVSLLHAPAPDISSDLLDLIWLSIMGAKDHILLATPYLTPPKEILEALEAARKRGVSVEVVVPGPYTDSVMSAGVTRSYYEELLEMGVRIYEYQPGLFHSKFLTVDGEWSLVGSANMDNRSATLNVENAFGIESRAFARALEEEFSRNKENAKERTLENFRPSPAKRLWYALTALFAKQF